jgi:hypothetical protein
MGSKVDWEAIEHSCPENRELGEIARRLDWVCRVDTPLDWAESRRRRAEILSAFFDESAKSQELVNCFVEAQYLILCGLTRLLHAFSN